MHLYNEIPEFITPAEQAEFVQWFNDNRDRREILAYSCRLKDGKCKADNSLRLTTRSTRTERDVGYPPIAYTVHERIRKHYGLNPNNPKRAMIAVITKPKGSTFEHKDAVDAGLRTITMNILMQKSEEGGLLHIEKTPHDFPERALHCYLPAEIDHKVTEVGGNRDRMMWIFRFTATDTQIDNIFNNIF
jgi:hypothetical protein